MSSYIETHTFRATPFFQVALLCTAMFLLALVWFIAWSGESKNQPGVSYGRSSAFDGATLRLLDSGNFVGENWCDVCGTNVTVGTWTASNGVIKLTPHDRSKPLLVLRKVDVKGCSFLVDAGINIEAAKVPRSYRYHSKDKACATLAPYDSYGDAYERH